MSLKQNTPPAQFGGNLVSAVAAGAAHGGLDAAYTSGSELNKAWGFIYNSGIPLGPTFDEFLGFLYGKSVDGRQTGLDLIQSILDRNKRGVIAIPIVGSPEQLSGYFSQPIGNAPGVPGIGLAGLCQKKWTLRYLILEALRKYVRANDAYWDDRAVPTRLRFEGCASQAGEGWEADTSDRKP